MSNKLIKTRWNDPNTGRATIIEMKASEIVANPARHEFEGIIAAICACTSELVVKEQERENRLKTILSSAAPLREVAINEGVN